MIDILLVEDEMELAILMRDFLENHGYVVKWVSTGEEAVDYVTNHRVKLVLLDIMLPGIDGFSVCSSIREKGNIPILIISARIGREDKLNGFTLGADDYIEKPVDIDLLLAKIGAVLQRAYQVESEKELIVSGELTVDKIKRQVLLKGKPVELNTKEYELLLLLVRNPRKTLHKDYIFGEIWGADCFSENQTLTVHIKMLRKKLEQEPKNPQRIQTVWGVGYRYEEI